MITISDKACEKLKEMLAEQEQPNMFLRVAVQAGGCSGFSYGMGFDDTQDEGDQTFDMNGLKVVVDPDSARYLYGVTIDYKESAMGGGFTIDNPNAIATCGCGSSFRTRDEEGVPEKC
jgi:iron-sulfur cluster assembly protein